MTTMLYVLIIIIHGEDDDYMSEPLWSVWQHLLVQLYCITDHVGSCTVIIPSLESLEETFSLWNIFYKWLIIRYFIPILICVEMGNFYTI